jgi:hypothetical protein
MTLSKSTIDACLKQITHHVKRETVEELICEITEKDEMTNELRNTLQTYIDNIPVKKGYLSIEKKKKRRYSGYHLYMKEHRKEIKTKYPEKKPQELIALVARSWKDVSDEEKNEFNRRAMNIKSEEKV